MSWTFTFSFKDSFYNFYIMLIMYEKYKYLGLGTALNKVRNFDKDRLIVYIDMQGRVAIFEDFRKG